MVNEPKKRSITGKLVANVLTEREDDFTGFMNNSLGVDGPFIGPGATFDPAKEENLPTITAVTDVVTAKVNSQLTPLVKPSLKRYAVIASLIN